MTDPLLIDVPERILTRRLVLRPPRKGDGAALCEAVQASLDDLRPWVPWARVEPTPADSEAYARRMQARFRLREDLPFLILERDSAGRDGRVLGATGLHHIDWTVPRLEIGYWRRSGHGGQGIVTEAVRALARMAFDALRAERVEIRMDDRNVASRRVAERAGFTLEGVLRRDCRTAGGGLRDTRVYARVRGVEEPSVVDAAGAG
jgi:RimJ/RimL family protein N-acetyltransferase